MRYAFIKRHVGEYAVSTMCRVVEVQSQGYYQWIRHSPSNREHRLAWKRCQIRALFAEFKGRYGSPRITKELRFAGHRCSERQVAKIMREEGLRARAAKKYRATTDSRHSLPVAKDLVQRNFKVERPNTVWAGDITYLWTAQGWLYLAVVLDLYSRRVVGWATSRFINVELVCEAFARAVARRNPSRGLIMHTDRGSQYASRDFQALLQCYGAVPSMSRKGNCWDNAVVETFFHSLKVEAIHGESFSTRDVAASCLFEYIERFYNQRRRHSTLEFLSPVEYERETQLRAVG